MGKKLAAFVVLSIAIVIALGTTVYRQEIRDQFVVRTTDLAVDSADLESRLELTDTASFIYQASSPEIQEAKEFNESCGGVSREQSIVLGCYTRQRFFVYNVTDERLNGVKEVTAAHELLHAVYERLSENEKQTLNAQLQTTAEAIEDDRFRSTLAEYRRTEPDQISNELHSILATEIEVLPSDLEQHYQKYFKNRQKIVGYAKQYEATFTSLDEQIKEYDLRLTALREQKEALEASLQAQQTEIEADQQQLQALRAANEVSAYNAAVPAYNQSIQDYNADVASLKQVVAQYNNLVEKRNTLTTTQNALVKQLDSNYQPLE